MISADSFHEWTEGLRRRLAGPLPGIEAQRAMAPVPRSNRIPRSQEHLVKSAAVVAVLYPEDCPDRGWEPRLVLTRRTDRVAHHKGQVCLPGGALDPGETLVVAARREFEEELGLPGAELEFLGELTPVYVPVSGFEVHPFVARVPASPRLTPDPTEVAGLLHSRILELLDPDLRGERVQEFDGIPVRVPFFRTQGQEVWGATAMMLSELCAVISTAEESRNS